jgi:hypothetical protein
MSCWTPSASVTNGPRQFVQIRFVSLPLPGPLALYHFNDPSLHSSCRPNLPQNTHLHGELDKNGIWRDGDGKTLPGATGGPKGPFKSLVGVKGAIQRVRGEGGF